MFNIRINNVTYDFSREKNVMMALRFKGARQQCLFKYARNIRDKVFSKQVEIRSVIEYSNVCQQACNYCGMSKASMVTRYILKRNQLISRVNKLYDCGRRIIILQAGECNNDNYLDNLFGLIKMLKNEYPYLVIVGSFGNLSRDNYKRLRDIGVDRYLLKFETSDAKLYRRIKPTDCLKKRLDCITFLKKIGFYVSSGNITGIPQQSLSSLADDIFLLKKLDICMGSTSPFIPNEVSNYRDCFPGDINLTLNFIAILRILCPTMLIPATSSLELIIKGGQYLGLMAGANVLTLHDGTPANKEKMFLLYKKNRYKPKGILFNIVQRAGLKPSLFSLVKNKAENSLFYKLVSQNVNRKSSYIYSDSSRYTYEEVLLLTSKCCSFLQGNNIKERDVVMLALFDSIEFIIVCLACIRLGIIVAPIDPLSTVDELRFLISDCVPKIILATDSIAKKLRYKNVMKITNDNCPKYFFSLLCRRKKSIFLAAVDKNNPAIILYTSGTTGKAKGVVHSYNDLLTMNFPHKILRVCKKDIFFSYSRIYTSFGFGNSLLFPLYCGASVILSRNIPNPVALSDVLLYNPTLFFAVPGVYKLLLRSRKLIKHNFSCVRQFISSGESLGEDIFKQWEKVYGFRLLDCFGTSEMCHPFISNIPGEEKSGTCGKTVEGFQVKFDKKGKMFYKGPSLFSGYYRRNKFVKETMVVDGWFESNDIGRVDKNGSIVLKGRDNLIFKINGKWISALNIEDKINRLELIKESAAIKKADGLYLYVSLNLKEIKPVEAISLVRSYCVEKLKINEFPVKINLLDEIPKTRSGKIKRQ